MGPPFFIFCGGAHCCQSVSQRRAPPMEAARPRHVLRTDLGRHFDRRRADPCISFGMCLDVGHFLLSAARGKDPQARPKLADLDPDRWESVRDRYRGDDPCGNPELIQERGLRTRSFSPLRTFDGHFLDLVYDIIQRRGTILVGLVGHGGAHELLWHRDDERDAWLFFDPFSGLWEFDRREGVAPSLAMDLVSLHGDRARLYRTSRLELG